MMLSLIIIFIVWRGGGNGYIGRVDGDIVFIELCGSNVSRGEFVEFVHWE